MYSRIFSFLEASDVFYSRQFCFRKAHSTNHALISMVERIKGHLDKGQVAVEAFDTVDHEILCHKLSHYGIRGSINQWFSSYLKNRSQFVSVSNCSSDIKQMHYGVPQSCVLGP